MKTHRTTILACAALAIVLILVGCPMPFQYSGDSVTSQSAEIDPSSPSITASPKIEYLADAGDAGVVEHESAVTTSSDTTVTLTSETINAVIYYTTDGSTPDPRGDATKRFDPSSPITLRIENPTVTESAASREIRAIAIGPNMKPSLQAVATVTVQYPQATAPVFDPIGGAYQTDQSVTLTTSTEDATIYYTVEDSAAEAPRPVPGQAGTQEYTGPISLVGPADTYSIAAIAVANQQLDSTTARAQYTIDYLGMANPTFNPPAGTYGNVQTVTISASPDATIWYTTDGSEPVVGTSNSMPAGGAVTVDRNMTVTAIADADQKDPSDVVSQSYTLQPDAPTFSLAGGSFGSTQTVTIQAQAGETVWYTTDGTAPTVGSSPSFAGSGNVTVDQSMTIRAVAHRTGWTASAEASETYTLVTQAPTMTPAGGTFASVQTVTIQGATGAEIWYTTDGSTPSASGAADFTTSGNVTVDQSMTIRAIARRPGWEPSAVAAELYRLPQILIDNGTHLITYEDYQDTIIFTLDVLSDTTDDRGSGDFYSLDVDVDQNGAVTSNVDVAYGIIGGTADSLCTQYLISANSSTGCGVFASGAVLTSDFTSTPANGTPHIVWELTVPKTELGGGTTADIVVKVHESGVGYTTYPTDNAQATSGLADFGSTLSFSW